MTLESGQELPYDRLLIATGSRAIPVDVPGARLDGVTKLDDLDDVRGLIKRSRTAKAAVVIGGGITAIEIVEGLRAHKVHVHYFMRKDHYWSDVLSDSESHIVEQGLRTQGVEIHFFAKLARILGQDGRVVGVETEDGQRIACDLVAKAFGVLPQVELAKAAGLDCGRGILVDQYLRSSGDDIFAAGDLAEVRDASSERRTVEVLWSSAVAKGRIAGLNMAGGSLHAYEAAAPLNVTRLAGLKFTIMGTVGRGKDSDLEGIARGGSETWPAWRATSATPAPSPSSSSAACPRPVTAVMPRTTSTTGRWDSAATSATPPQAGPAPTSTTRSSRSITAPTSRRRPARPAIRTAPAPTPVSAVTSTRRPASSPNTRAAAPRSSPTASAVTPAADRAIRERGDGAPSEPPRRQRTAASSAHRCAVSAPSAQGDDLVETGDQVGGQWRRLVCGDQLAGLLVRLLGQIEPAGLEPAIVTHAVEQSRTPLAVTQVA